MPRGIIEEGLLEIQGGRDFGPADRSYTLMMGWFCLVLGVNFSGLLVVGR